METFALVPIGNYQLFTFHFDEFFHNFFSPFSNTNTYSCVRNVNGTHNYLYCEFVSGTITYYNLKVDPYQLRNIYLTLSPEELNFMHRQLAVLKNQGVQHQKRHYSKQRSFIQRYGNII